MKNSKIPPEALIDLKRQLDVLSENHKARKALVSEVANMFSINISTVYRLLRKMTRPRSAQRKDCGSVKVLPIKKFEFYCELIATLKEATKNKNGRHLSTKECIRIFETDGINYEGKNIKAEKGILKKSTVDRMLDKLHLNARSLKIETCVVRFQAEYSNQCWQFDMSPSDLKSIHKLPHWMEEFIGKKKLMLYSIVDDRSGYSYIEYHLTDGEDVLAALRFLYNAMSEKNDPDFPLQGIPSAIYTDNGPVSKSALFQRVVFQLGINLKSHMPKGKGGNKTESRAKGKVERPFKTVKEAHETLYHFHTPETVEEANQWLFHYLKRYNSQSHRNKQHSRMEDWIKNIPAEGIKKMCSWEHFCTLVREPQIRKVTSDAHVSLDGILYKVDDELVGREVTVWYGLLDNNVFIDYNGDKFGPFTPTTGPISLGTYRSAKLTAAERALKKIEKMVEKISLPRSVVDANYNNNPHNINEVKEKIIVKSKLFEIKDVFEEFRFSTTVRARMFIASLIGVPLGSLEQDKLDRIQALVSETLEKKKIIDGVQEIFYIK